MVSLEYRNAFSEVYYLINKMQAKNREKISKKFVKFIENNKNNDYVPTNLSLGNPDGLKNQTKVILSLIYRNYFCDEEEKINLQKQDEEFLENLYSYDNLFKKETKKEDEENEVIENKALVEVSGIRKVILVIKEKLRKIFKL